VTKPQRPLRHFAERVDPRDRVSCPEESADLCGRVREVLHLLTVEIDARGAWERPVGLGAPPTATSASSREAERWGLQVPTPCCEQLERARPLLIPAHPCCAAVRPALVGERVSARRHRGPLSTYRWGLVRAW